MVAVVTVGNFERIFELPNFLLVLCNLLGQMCCFLRELISFVLGRIVVGSELIKLVFCAACLCLDIFLRHHQLCHLVCKLLFVIRTSLALNLSLSKLLKQLL